MGQALADPDGDFADFFTAFLLMWESRFGTYTLLEHGSSSDMRGSACINHAHMHVMAVDFEEVMFRMRSDGLELLDIGGWQALDARHCIDSSYFFVGDRTRGLAVLDPPHMPSQYLRIAAGGTLGIDAAECDWAVVVRRGLLAETLAIWQGDESYPRPVDDTEEATDEQ